MKLMMIAVLLLAGMATKVCQAERRGRVTTYYYTQPSDGHTYYDAYTGRPTSKAVYDQQLATYNAYYGIRTNSHSTRDTYGRSYSTTNNHGTSYNTTNNHGPSYNTINNYGDSHTTVNNYGRGRTTVNDYGAGSRTTTNRSSSSYDHDDISRRLDKILRDLKAQGY